MADAPFFGPTTRLLRASCKKMKKGVMHTFFVSYPETFEE
jgi:hypothetical protein